jgi:hypothetical protein
MFLKATACVNGAACFQYEKNSPVADRGQVYIK